MSLKSKELKTLHENYESKLNDLLVSADLIENGLLRNDRAYIRELFRIKAINHANVFISTMLLPRSY